MKPGLHLVTYHTTTPSQSIWTSEAAMMSAIARSEPWAGSVTGAEAPLGLSSGASVRSARYCKVPDAKPLNDTDRTYLFIEMRPRKSALALRSSRKQNHR